MGFVSNRKNKGFGEVTVNEKKVESLIKQIRRKMRENDEGEIAFFATKKTFRQELAKAVERLYAMPAYRDYIFLSPVNKGEMLSLLSENSNSITSVLTGLRQNSLRDRAQNSINREFYFDKRLFLIKIGVSAIFSFRPLFLDLRGLYSILGRQSVKVPLDW